MKVKICIYIWKCTHLTRNIQKRLHWYANGLLTLESILIGEQEILVRFYRGTSISRKMKKVFIEHYLTLVKVLVVLFHLNVMKLVCKHSRSSVGFACIVRLREIHITSTCRPTVYALSVCVHGRKLPLLHTNRHRIHRG